MVFSLFLYFVFNINVDRVPTTIALTEILIIVDADVDESSVLFNSSIYNNANVNIIARTDSWTLSELFLLPRIFRRVRRYAEIINNHFFNEKYNHFEELTLLN